jgi:hypothetical protein
MIRRRLQAAGPNRTPYFYRTEDGAEIDLLFERGGVIEAAIEIKRSSAPELSKGFHFACDAVRPREAFVVHGGDGTWPMRGGVTALPLVDLMRRLTTHRG